MKAFKPKSASALSAGLLLLSLTCSAYAGVAGEPGAMRDNPGSYSADTGKGVKHRSYGQKIGHKLLRGFANMTTAVVELPKNVINATNAGGIGGEGSNFLWGISGGSIKGIVDMIGRTGSGIVDVLTFPLPTKSIPKPEYPWEQFNEDTSYGNIFQYDDD
jgi:putative exosortase-associated protein (TIGR04073 family)